MSATEAAGELVILEFERMSSVTDQYVKRTRNVADVHYTTT